MSNNNVLSANLAFIHYINSNMAMYKDIEDNYLKICGDFANADRCYQYRIALSIVSDEFDRYVLQYEDVSIWDYLNSNGTIWHMQSFIGKQIDAINSCGYHYIMRYCPELRNQLHMYERIYDEIKRICRTWDVYC